MNARCPACQAWYTVVPDQLRISGGWVRCGQCGDVFDASLQLIDAKSEPPSDLTQTEPPEFPLQPDGVDAALPEASIVSSAPTTIAYLPAPSSEAHVTSPISGHLPPEVQPEVSWDSAALLVKPSWDAETGFGPETVDKPESVVTASGKSAVLPAAEPVSFMRAPHARPTMHRRGVHRLWAGLSVLLMLGLLLQGLYRERDLLAAAKPEFKPALATFCELFGCRISPLQRIEALALDSVTFHQMDPEVFQLQLVLKNKAPLALALPTVELTLTDVADQPVIRRVLTPAELGATANSMMANGEWMASADLRVKAENTQQRALGYRLLVFYP